MNKSKYFYSSDNEFKVYHFVSEGPKGRIKKMIIYSKTENERIYNLAFGDYNKETDSIDDLSVTNNGDSLKILATVASTIYSFMDKYPDSYIFATGSTRARTRLYRMGITNNLAEITKDFFVFGLCSNDEWEGFIVGEDYEGFLITKKDNRDFNGLN